MVVWEAEVCVSDNQDRIVKVWDAVPGQQMLTLAGHTDAMHSLPFLLTLP